MRHDPTAIPSPLAGEGARRADEGAPPRVIVPRKRPPATSKDLVLRRFAKSMRHEPTDAEAKLWRVLRARRFSGYKFRRQVTLGAYIIDFVCFETRLIVEADGSRHADSASDPRRDAWLRQQGFRIRRFWNADILLRPIEVADTIWADLAGET